MPTGIRGHTEQRIISGCRVAFDRRTTEQVCTTRDDKNYMASEKYMREQNWHDRQAAKRQGKDGEE